MRMVHCRVKIMSEKKTSLEKLRKEADDSKSKDAVADERYGEAESLRKRLKKIEEAVERHKQKDGARDSSAPLDDASDSPAKVEETLIE